MDHARSACPDRIRRIVEGRVPSRSGLPMHRCHGHTADISRSPRHPAPRRDDRAGIRHARADVCRHCGRHCPWPAVPGMTGALLRAATALRVRHAALSLLIPILAACVVAVSFPGPAAAEERDSCDAAAPLRTVNLNPFHISHGPPSSFDACVLSPGTTEFIASLDIASHMGEARSGQEKLWMDGETSRYALAVRRGFQDSWEYLLELSVISHNAGVSDGFIEN